MRDEVTTVCEQCGASVYKQHLDSGIARYENGKLLCSHCVAEFERAHDTGVVDEGFEPIEFDDEERPSDHKEELSKTRFHTSAATLGIAGVWDESKFKRPLLPPSSPGATRCRTFHCKLTEAAVDYMNGQINDWLEHNDGLVIKFASSTIGNFEGKHTEPNLIVTVFY